MITKKVYILFLKTKLKQHKEPKLNHSYTDKFENHLVQTKKRHRCVECNKRIEQGEVCYSKTIASSPSYLRTYHSIHYCNTCKPVPQEEICQ